MFETYFCLFPFHFRVSICSSFTFHPILPLIESLPMLHSAQYISHLSGQQHMKRVRGECGPEYEISTGSGLVADGRGNTYWCDTCKITMTGHQPFEAHMNGAKHKAKVIATTVLGPFGPPQGPPPKGPPPKAGQKRGFNAPGGVPFSSGPSNPQEPKPPKAASKDTIINEKCDVCNIVLKTQSNYDAHMAGRFTLNIVFFLKNAGLSQPVLHTLIVTLCYFDLGQLHMKKKKMLDEMGGRVVMPAGSLARKILDGGPMVLDGVLHCKLCDMNFITMQIGTEHFTGRKHRAAMRAMAVAHEEGNPSGAAGWITGVSTLSGDGSVSADSSAGPYAGFVAGGTISNLSSLGLDLDKDSIDAKIKEARIASGDTTDEAGKDGVDAHVKAFELARKDGANGSASTDNGSESKEGTPAAEGAAEAMDMLVREVSPNDTTAIVCDICNIGVTTTQMLENHVIGSKHLKKVLSVAVGEGKDVKGIRGRGVPFTPRGRGRGRGRGGMGFGRGRGGGFRGRGSGFGGIRGGGGRPAVPVVPAAEVMAGDNDGSSHDYLSIKHKPPIGYSSKPGWASWNDSHVPGSGGWTPWTG